MSFPRPQDSAPSLALLNCKSCYSFMDGLLTPERIAALSAAAGARFVALTDPNLHGAVPFAQAAEEAGVEPIVAAEIRVARASGRAAARANVYVESSEGYANLCAMLSLPGPVPQDAFDDLRRGLRVVLLDASDAPALLEIRYAAPSDRLKYAVLQSIRAGTLLRQRHPEKRPSGGLHFPGREELRRRRAAEPEAWSAAAELARSCGFRLRFGQLHFPVYKPPDGSSSSAFLRRLTLEGFERRYLRPGPSGRRRPDAPHARRQVERELAIIGQVGYEDYFLVVWDLLQACRARGMEWITRGSAGDSLVCHCLGFSDFDPIRFELYFQRFLNLDRMAMNKLPDIDLDFAHDRRDEAVDLLLGGNGPGRAALVGGFSTFRARSAVAEIAKVFGVSESQIRSFTERIAHSGALSELPASIAAGPESRDLPVEEEPYATALALAAMLDGLPRHPKMHPCGVVLSRGPIHALTPTFATDRPGWRATHFDMDAVEDVGLVKFDILAQGGLAVMRDARRSVIASRRRGDEPRLPASSTGRELEPWDDPEVWNLVASGGARGVHHVESPAMLSLCRMCDPKSIDVLIAIVSVIRPGAANQLRKQSFARRSLGREPVEYPHPSLEPCLRSTFGVMAYEEHVLQICEVFAGIPPGVSDQLRRALVKCRDDQIEAFGGRFREAARAFGRDAASIERVWALLKGFRGYAFCRAHSTAYALEAYQAAWLKRYFPAAFIAGALTHGKGFYPRSVYALEARLLGVELRPPCVNRSEREAFLVESDGEGSEALRVPLGLVDSLSEATLDRWRAERTRSPFVSPSDFALRVEPEAAEVERLLRCGALDGFGWGRVKLFWELRRLARWPRQRGQQWLFAPDGDDAGEPALPPALEAQLSEPTLAEKVADETRLLGFPVSGHPLDAFPEIDSGEYETAAEVERRGGGRAKVCGVVVESRIHRQATGEPMKFLSLADRSGILEVELFADAYRKHGAATVRYPAIEIEGAVQPFESGRGTTLRAERVSTPERLERPFAAKP